MPQSDKELREAVTRLLWGGRTDVDGVIRLISSEREAAVKKNESLCGCPMCSFHSEAYKLSQPTKGEHDTTGET